MNLELTPDEIIDALGGTSETARLCEVEPPSVSEWRKNGIPHARMMFIKAVRPDIFAPPVAPKSSANTSVRKSTA